MTIYIPRKAPLLRNFEWLRMLSCSASYCKALQREYGRLAYANMAGSQDASHSLVCLTCECAVTESRDPTWIKKCTYTKKAGLTCSLNSAHVGVSTSTEMCTHMKKTGSPKDFTHFALHCRMSMNKYVCFSHVLPCSHAMTRAPQCAHQGFLYNMGNHMKMYSSDAEANLQCCPCGEYNSEEGFLVCPVCNAVQAPNSAISYFRIFDQDEKFELDLKDLEANYKRLMKKLHPDLSHGKSMEEKENYAQLSALVTTAYNELLKPISRATYMLKLRGIHVEVEGTVTDSELITEVFEMRESLLDAPDRKTLEQLRESAKVRMDTWTEAFKSALKDGDDTKAVGALQRMSYFGRLLNDIDRELL